MSNTLNKIMASGSKAAADEPSEYRSYVDSGARPQMGFSITRANGDMDGFLYHTLDNMQLQTKNGSDFLSFTHRGKAVTIQGTALRVIFRLMMRHTLMEINEPNGRPAAAGMPVIQRLEITTVGEKASAAVRLAG
jgi:hypothetical protein